MSMLFFADAVNENANRRTSLAPWDINTARMVTTGLDAQITQSASALLSHV